MISPFYTALQRLFASMLSAFAPKQVEAIPGEDGYTDAERPAVMPSTTPAPAPVPEPVKPPSMPDIMPVPPPAAKDKVTVARIQLLHPALQPEAALIYEDICIALTGRTMCRFTHTLRTFKEQTDLYAQGRTVPGKKVTNAQAGKSFHNYGLAIDICLIIDGKEASWDTIKDHDADQVSDWMEVVRIFKSYGWEWGGDWARFPDKPHFQKTMGKTIDDLLHRHRTGQFIEGTTYVAI